MAGFGLANHREIAEKEPLRIANFVSVVATEDLFEGKSRNIEVPGSDCQCGDVVEKSEIGPDFKMIGTLPGKSVKDIEDAELPETEEKLAIETHDSIDLEFRILP
jgi:hypothetical protein